MAPRIQVFRVGKHTTKDGQQIAFSADDLRKTAAVYDRSKHDAPLVVGHPREDAPAYGWVHSVHFTADGVLEVQPEQVEPRFAAMVNEGRFRHVSACFYRPDAPRNPAPGTWSLKHVGFLGAAAPSVEGLKPARFAADEQGVVEFGAEVATPAAGDGTPTAEELRREREELQREKAELQREKAQLAVEKKLGELGAFVEPLIQAGRLLPRHKEQLVAFMAQLPESATVSFSQGGEQRKLSAADWFKGFLGELPVQVIYGEVSRPEPSGDGGSAGFSAPEGQEVDAARLELHRRAEGYARQHKCSYLEAVKAVQGGVR